MRIAVNTRLLLKDRLDGIGWFTYFTMKEISRRHPEVEFFFLFDRPWDPSFVFGSNITPIALPPQARHPILYYLWFEHAVPRALRKIKADLFISPDGFLSLSTPVKQLSVIHDLNFEHDPKDIPFITRKYYLHYFHRFARKAARIATVSEFSKNDIISTYGIDESKIDVVYNGVSDLYRPVEETVIREMRARYTSGAPYFLFVGMLHRRKNIANLFRAFDAFRQQSVSNIKLLIVGQKKWWTGEMESVYSSMRFRDEVIFTGRLPMEELVKVTASALAVTYVSCFEGFGVPIIEAMRCGVPVITSSVTSMPEVAGGAALTVDPFNPSAITEAMINLASDATLRSDLSKKGIENSRRFSWEHTADKLWNTILKTI